MATSDFKHPKSLWNLAAAPVVDEALLMQALMADRTTARLLFAWRRSVADLEDARAAAEANGQDTTWLDLHVSVQKE